jgi:hypothetical protein
MKSILHVVLWLVPAVLAIIGSSIALACSYPAAESIALTWPPLAKVSAIGGGHQLLISLTGHLLTSYPACRVVRSSTALLRLVVFCATCGVMFIPRSSRTNSCVS